MENDPGGDALTQSEKVLFAISKDQGPVKTIGGSFLVPGGNIFAQNSMMAKGMQYFGLAVASPIALYLVKADRNKPTTGLVSNVLYSVLAKENAMSTCSVQDLPEAVRSYVDPKHRQSDREVIIIPKGSVSIVKVALLDNMISFKVGSEKFTVFTFWFCQHMMGRRLQELAWQLNVPLTPTSVSVHDVKGE